MVSLVKIRGIPRQKLIRTLALPANFHFRYRLQTALQKNNCLLNKAM